MAGKLRKLLDDKEIISALDTAKGSLTEASMMLSDLIGQNVSVQVLATWVRDLNYQYQKKDQAPKILLFDIETTPILAYVWGLFKQDIPISAIKRDWEVLCWSAKWLGKHRMYNANFVDESEAEVVTKLWEMLDEAEVVVAHNGKNFDVKKMNAKFLEYGLGNPSYYQVVDTLQIAKGNLNLTSNKLDFIAKFLHEDRKNKVDLQLWIDCMNYDKKAMREMQKYCDQDVRVLEQVYLKLRYLDKKSPQYGAYVGSEKMVCNACGSDKLIYTADKHTGAGTQQVYTCCDCSHNNVIRANVKPKKFVRVGSV